MTTAYLPTVVLIICYLWGIQTSELVAAGNSTSPTCDETADGPGVPKTLRLLSMLPYPANPDDPLALQPMWDIGLSILPAAQLAVKHINQDPSTLSGYRVELVTADGGCNIVPKTLTSFTEHVLHSHGPPIAGIIGPGCIVSSLLVSSLLNRPGIHLPNVHLATSPLLEDRNQYRTAYGIVGSSVLYIQLILSLIEHNDWRNVAILYDSAAYIHINKRLRDTVAQLLDKQRVVFYSEMYDKFLPHDTLTKSSAKVVMTLTVNIDLTLKLMCIGHTRGRDFSRQQWIIIGQEPLVIASISMHDTTFHYSGVFYGCKNSELLQNHLIAHYSFDNTSMLSVSGLSYDEIVDQYLLEIDNLNRGNCSSLIIVPHMQWAMVTYDAVWALALAINRSLISNTSTSTNSLQFGTKGFTDKIKQSLDEIKFNGLSGEIDFDNKTGFTCRVIDIFKIEVSNSSVNRKLVARLVNSTLVTNGPQVFIDTTHIIETKTVLLSLAVIFLLIIIVLCLATVLLHILSIVKREHPLVKASSLPLNHFVFFGCYVWTAGAVIYIVILKTLSHIDESAYANCCHAVWVWLLPIGCTLTFGTLAVKTWRIYRIFIHFRNPGRLISNRVLIALVFIQLSFDAVIGTLWSILSPTHLYKTEMEVATNHAEGTSVKYITYVQQTCIFVDHSGSIQIYWIVILYCYKVLQTLVLLTLTLLTRNIQNKRFNTFLLRQASYLSLLLFISILPTFTTLWYFNAEIHIDFVLLCTLIIGIVSILFSFILLFPVLPILRQMFSSHF